MIYIYCDCALALPVPYGVQGFDGAVFPTAGGAGVVEANWSPRITERLLKEPAELRT